MRLAAAAAIAVLLALGSGAWAQQALTGVVTMVDRINGTVTIQQTSQQTSGSASGAPSGATELYKAKAEILETLHAGDSVKYSVNEAGGAKTISQIDKQ